MPLTPPKRLLAAVVAALLSLPVASAPLAAVATGGAQAPLPAPMAVMPRAPRLRRLRRYLKLRRIDLHRLGLRATAVAARGARRVDVPRRRPIRAAAARGPPR